MEFTYDSDLMSMTEPALYDEAESQAGEGVGSEIGNVIAELDQAKRIAVLRLLNQLMRMIGGS